MKRLTVACALLLLLTACSTPERDCRDGIAETKKKVSAMITSELASAAPAVQQELNAAKDARDAGKYAECVEAIARARAAISASMRTNQ